MVEQLEQRLRSAMHAVDRADLGTPDAVLALARARLQRRSRNRNLARGGAVVGIVAVTAAGLVTIADRAAPTETLDETFAVPTVPAPDATPQPPPDSSSPPPEDSFWRPIAQHPEGIGWVGAAVWMGEEAFVLRNQAYAYDPVSDGWRALARFPATWTAVDECQDTPATCVGQPSGEDPDGWSTVDPIVVWAGEKVLVIGGDQPLPENTAIPDDCRGAECYPNLLTSATLGYVPDTDTWEALAAPPWFVNARSPHAWTGTELLVWPWDIDDTPDPAFAYSPTSNTWRQLPDVPIAARQNAASVWTGTEWIVWGGGDDDREYSDGAAYNPATDTWRVLAEAPITARKTSGVWTGREFIVMAGSVGGGTTVCCGNHALSDGAAYDPDTDTWRTLSGTVGHPGFELLWADGVLLMFAKGGVIVYNPADQTYIDICCDGMAGSTHIWTGTEAISFGSHTASRGGGIFTPPSNATSVVATTGAPTPDTRPTDTRTGREDESFDVVSAFGEISDDALAVTTDGRVAAAVGETVRVRDLDGRIESVALPDGVTADQLWIGTDDIGVAWSESGGVEIDLAQLTIVSRLARTNDEWARTEIAPGMMTAPLLSGHFNNPLNLALLVHEGTVVPEAEGAGCFEVVGTELGESWLFGRPAACASAPDEIAPRTGGGYFLTMRGQGADNTNGLYLLELAPDEFDPHYASIVTLPPVDTVIDAQPTSDGLTLLHRQGSTVTIRHVTSDTSAK